MTADLLLIDVTQWWWRCNTTPPLAKQKWRSSRIFLSGAWTPCLYAGAGLMHQSIPTVPIHHFGLLLQVHKPTRIRWWWELSEGWIHRRSRQHLFLNGISILRIGLHGTIFPVDWRLKSSSRTTWLHLTSAVSLRLHMPVEGLKRYFRFCGWTFCLLRPTKRT